MLNEEMYYVKFNLYPEAPGYNDANLRNYEKTIQEAIKKFAGKESRKIDKGTMELVNIEEKSFTVFVTIAALYGPPNRSFCGRIGALSKTLLETGMKDLATSFNRFFKLSYSTSMEEKFNSRLEQLQKTGTDR